MDLMDLRKTLDGLRSVCASVEIGFGADGQISLVRAVLREPEVDMGDHATPVGDDDLRPRLMRRPT